MEPELQDQIHVLVWSCAHQLATLDGESSLVHGDFGKGNLLVRQVAGKWTVVAVLDWEFAISGSALTDVGHFLRYESASRPLSSHTFQKDICGAGGRLRDGWRRLVRVLDLIVLCESLTHDELPCDVVAELVELVRATVENRDPEF